MIPFSTFLAGQTVLIDGAMGTEVQRRRPDLRIAPDMCVLHEPALIESIHYDYLVSGVDVLTTNTFGANGYKCADTDTTPSALIHAAVGCARRARERYISDHGTRPIYVALDIGPIGTLLAPAGDMSPERAYDLYREQVEAGGAAGVDLIIIETQTDLAELKYAVLAAREHSDLPVLVSMSFEHTGRTFTGTDVVSMATTLEGLGVTAVGINCSFGAAETRPLVDALLAATKLPLIVQPNGGIPDADGHSRLDVQAHLDHMRYFLSRGVEIIGGCCGTDPALMARLHALRGEVHGTRPSVTPVTRVSSYAETVVLGQGPLMIGERINPTGKRELQEELRRGVLDRVVREAVVQRREGAALLDINVGTSGVDEPTLLPRAVRAVQAVTGTPLVIDTASPTALAAAARAVAGKPLLNSVNAGEDSLAQVLPIARRYGACVLGLTLDENGIPDTAKGRLALAEKIVTRALEWGIPRENILIDCLTLTLGTGAENARITAEAVALVKRELGVATALGVSNISFGMPERSIINRTFLQMALAHGLDAPIANPGDRGMTDTLAAYRVLAGYDDGAREWIARVRKVQDEAEAPSPVSTILAAIVDGLEAETLRLTKELLARKAPLDVVNEDLIGALNEVGRRFETQELFLPQLIRASQTAQVAFAEVKRVLEAKGETAANRGTIILATVRHDVHDIGKNIVKVVLENYGYRIIDLGKDVPPQAILDACRTYHARLVGLSALMTTTVASMQETIALLKREIPDVQVVVGGAVLNERYAADIGADQYAAHPAAMADIAAAFFGTREDPMRQAVSRGDRRQ